ncbi:hypothetical protein BpHYR1_017774 [Brachionus plicatilis]|uniref:Uncharacterized protein n=1 Tax=Brachionus plicatilis TaxID=10195 RepID=A0A3M7PFY6_BRAPC|nr:hypothetical protein BpHYR1_017774 [Brachionus plicatilis]
MAINDNPRTSRYLYSYYLSEPSHSKNIKKDLAVANIFINHYRQDKRKKTDGNLKYLTKLKYKNLRKV